MSNDNITFNSYNVKASFINALSDYNTQTLKTLGFDGIFGLGLAPNGESTYVSTLYSNKVIGLPQFALFYENNALKVYLGEYAIDGYEISNVVNVSATPATNSLTYWSIPVTSIVLNNISIVTNNPILSASYSTIQVDSVSYGNILESYQKSGTCTSNGTFIICDEAGGDLTLQVDGKILTVKSDVLWQKNNNSYTLLIQNSTQIILGGALLQSYLTVFSYAPLNVTFLSAVPSGSLNLAVSLIFVVIFFGF
jgi:Eukaryotic aspartyl protease